MLPVVDDDDGGTAPDVDAGAAGLVERVPYVRGWADAERAAELLCVELAAWGIGRRVAVRARVNPDGAGVVELGWVSPELAALLADLLTRARQQPCAHTPESGRGPRAA